jgi:hypothetical protein
MENARMKFADLTGVSFYFFVMYYGRIVAESPTTARTRPSVAARRDET